MKEQEIPGPWIEIHTGLDHLSRAYFTIRWMSYTNKGWKIKGQVFFINPDRFSHYKEWDEGKEANEFITKGLESA